MLPGRPAGARRSPRRRRSALPRSLTDELGRLLAKARDLSKAYQRGGDSSAVAFLDLIQFLLALTVSANGGLKAERGPRRPRDRIVISGRAGEGAVPLRDGRFLKVVVSLFLDHQPEGRLKVEKSVFQYQVDELGDQWIVRYEYQRDPAGDHAAMHLHVRGTLTETGVLPRTTPLERIHFPTDRISIEAVIPLLADEFKIPTSAPRDTWRRVLAETESEFQKIAHRTTG